MYVCIYIYVSNSTFMVLVFILQLYFLQNSKYRVHKKGN